MEIKNIYGIEDDANYSLKLQNLIKDQTNIKICEPVFGIEKQKIMSESWANILISKSEVLSLSIFRIIILWSTNVNK